MISLANISFAYADGEKATLKNVSLDIEEGERLVIVGPSGCGKSTLLRLIAGLEQPTSGIVNRGSDKLSFVFQSPALMPWASVFDNVALPSRLSGVPINREVALNAIKAVGLESFEARYPNALSGGQQMRTSIARAIAADSAIALLDEPFSAIDEILRFNINDLYHEIHVKHKWTSVFVTHSLYEAAYIASRIIILKAGRIIDDFSENLSQEMPDKSWRQSESYHAAVLRCQTALASDEGSVLDA